MKFHYYPETDSLYIELVERPGEETREVTDCIVLDLDKNKQLVGIDIQHASEAVDLSRLETIAMPIDSLTMIKQAKTA